jgi:hypothetical protein
LPQQRFGHREKLGILLHSNETHSRTAFRDLEQERAVACADVQGRPAGVSPQVLGQGGDFNLPEAIDLGLKSVRHQLRAIASLGAVEKCT